MASLLEESSLQQPLQQYAKKHSPLRLLATLRTVSRSFQDLLDDDGSSPAWVTASPSAVFAKQPDTADGSCSLQDRLRSAAASFTAVCQGKIHCTRFNETSRRPVFEQYKLYKWSPDGTRILVSSFDESH
ncbi:hypothetical protein WJX84_002787 [Apatococcus fuscideae]|uniref:F-box domain-containing protein n=1 Tax=Apatococcus fuscideae TaxID=2026836 RepID=A0AAW1SVQ4_9CHLO